MVRERESARARESESERESKRDRGGKRVWVWVSVGGGGRWGEERGIRGGGGGRKKEKTRRSGVVKWDVTRFTHLCHIINYVCDVTGVGGDKVHAPVTDSVTCKGSTNTHTHTTHTTHTHTQHTGVAVLIQPVSEKPAKPEKPKARMEVVSNTVDDEVRIALIWDNSSPYM